MHRSIGAGRWRRFVTVIAIVVLIVIVVVYFILMLPQFGGKLDSGRLARMQANPHYHHGKFVNPLPPGPYTWALTRDLLKGQLFGNEVRVPPSAIPVIAVKPDDLKIDPATPRLRAFWIGHASIYIEIDGLRMLTDPIFSEYASPFDIGPKRFHPPPISLNDLPKIDAVLITHDHYDHLDMKTVQQLAKKGASFFVPLGIGAHLAAWGIPETQIHDMEWWQELALNGVRIISTPSRHYSGRSLTDKDATLWTSWSVIGPKHSFYVSGDTGYSDHFKTIGDKLGPFDMSFIKIGAYGPGAPWFDIHMTAENAVQASVDVKARRMFPEHWATFNLAFHDWDEPVKRALAAARTSHVDLVTPRVGEMVDADQQFQSTSWWESVR